MEESGYHEESVRKKLIEEGFICLNLNKTGALGSSKAYWNKEKIFQEAKKYKTRTEFKNCSQGAYDAAINSGIIDEACSHMIVIMKKRSNSKIFEEIRAYRSINEVLAKDRKLYMAAWRRGLLQQINDYFKN